MAAKHTAGGTNTPKPSRGTAKMIKAAKQPAFMDPSARTRPTKKTEPIRVRATLTGYYDHARRRPGDVFTVEASQFSKRWMEPVDPDTPARLTTAAESIRQQHDEILGTRQASRDDSVI